MVKDAKPAGQQLAEAVGMPAWGQALVKVLWWVGGIIVLALGVLFAQLYFLHGDVGELQGKISNLPASIAQSLLQESQRYLSGGDMNAAAKSLKLGAEFLAVANTQKIPSSPAYFREVAGSLARISSVPQLKDETRLAFNQLAAYHSALAQEPEVDQTKRKELNSPVLASENQPKITPSSFQGRTVLVLATPMAEAIQVPIVRKLSSNFSVSDLVFFAAVPGSSQTLDGVHWDGVTFVNMAIKYEGGEVELNKVRFINCTFDIENDARGVQLATSIATQDAPSLLISQTSASSGPLGMVALVPLDESAQAGPEPN